MLSTHHPSLGVPTTSQFLFIIAVISIWFGMQMDVPLVYGGIHFLYQLGNTSSVLIASAVVPLRYFRNSIPHLHAVIVPGHNLVVVT